jgi:hypothetical protein
MVALSMGTVLFSACSGLVGEREGTGQGGTTGSTLTGAGGSAGTSGGASGLPCDVAALISSKCVTCHGTTPIVGVPTSLVTYADLTAPSKSDPTQTNAALAVTRMTSTTNPMPPAGSTPASAAEIAAVQSWIAAGYPMTGCGADGGTISDPFSVAPTCTSMTTWRGGTEGSALMEPGMTCVSCHATTGGEAPRFAVAGTVYPTAHEPDLCNGASGANGARVVITGANGASVTLTPNAAGNFSYEGTIATPYSAKVTYMGRERAMGATQTSGDCNACHTQAGAMSAPGRILLP